MVTFSLVRRGEISAQDARMKKLQKAHVIGMEFQPRLKWDLGHM